MASASYIIYGMDLIIALLGGYRLRPIEVGLWSKLNSFTENNKTTDLNLFSQGNFFTIAEETHRSASGLILKVFFF